MKLTRKQLGFLIKSIIKESTEEFDSPDYKYFSKALELVKTLKEAQDAYSEIARSVLEQERMISRIKNDTSGFYGLAGTAAMGTGVPQEELRARDKLKEEAYDKFDAAFDALEDFGQEILDYGRYEDLKDEGFSEEDLRVFRGQGWGKKSEEVKISMSSGGFESFWELKGPYARHNVAVEGGWSLERPNSDDAARVIDALEDFLQNMLVPVDMPGYKGSRDVSRIPDGLKK